MNSIKTLKDTLKKTPLPNNSTTARHQWENIVDGILASKPVNLNSIKEVNSNVVHLDPITVPKGASINWLSTFISEDVTFTSLASGSAPAVGVRISLNEPIETKANADTWLIPNVVLKVENGVPDLASATLPTTSSECHFLINESGNYSFQGGDPVVQSNSLRNGVLSGSVIHPPLFAPSNNNTSNGYTSESINADKMLRGTQIICGPDAGYKKAYRNDWGYYSGSTDSARENIQNGMMNQYLPLGVGYNQIVLSSINGSNSLYNTFTNDAVKKNIIESTSNSWDLRTFNSETKIYMSLYFFSYDINQYNGGTTTNGIQSRFVNEVNSGTVGSFLNTTPLTIETPGEVTFTATILNN